MNFSVLISVYNKEKPEYFKASLESLFMQVKKPNEVVIVKDGELTPQLEDVIINYSRKLNIKTIPLKENVGLGLALAKGLLECSYDIVARMDSDDICRPDRFEKQLKFLENHPNIDLVGSFISEFDKYPDCIYAYRTLKTTPDEINKISRYRCPINHVTAVFRKKSVIEAGNYQSFLGIEDYDLWARMLLNGARFANIPEPLVNVRGGINQVIRRSGIKYLKTEIRLQRKFLAIGFTKFHQSLVYLLLRIPVRISPRFLKILIYKKIIRKKNLK